MERLTIPDKKVEGGWERTVVDPKEVKKYAMTIYWALKKYEDTGLMPEQIRQIDDLHAEKCREVAELRKAQGWISVEERLPEEKVNPVSQDFYEYQVTAKFGNVKDVRHYKYGNGHWWHGPGIVDEYVTAWRPLPEPYQPERKEV